MSTGSSDADADCGIRVVDADRVASVRAALPAEERVTEASEVFSLLGDPGRLKLLVALLEGEMCVCDLAAACGQGESAVSHQLRLLRAHRVVTARRSGRMAYYRLADAHVRLLLDVTLAHLDHARDPEAGSAASGSARPGSAAS
ncbi:metalloregulator ArsR/SmtB family transcription factor [Yinghuangia sp. ASG 101]|uniref:ArsR/SmtB family transcription factor n=1 Tax=Yinghuangia sp. ASG 101 TaxID=2896848 RepID=UPI001E58BC94|nr:metalloregulator ArsR/SmtB family transcription factor [Yinghuangia sp. ASG 101]UGQ12844.1 metalloregulator ArsR/SmtB family transcription factor [Yinghuangia sp. ASG 101]